VLLVTLEINSNCSTNCFKLF